MLLIDFIIKGNIEMVERSIIEGADVNAEYGYPLRTAAMCGHHKIAELLIEKGADINVMQNTMSPVELASANGHLETVKWLHENRKEGCTKWAMNWAARYDHLDVVIWLHENRHEGCTTKANELVIL